jgi:heparosan-N-sulfate-glucuronate 5-epimerase
MKTLSPMPAGTPAGSPSARLAEAAPKSPGVAARGRRYASYLGRALQVYARPSAGPLSFWYEIPEVNPAAFPAGRRYFMRFQRKARYAGPFDDAGIPMLDYRGDIGRQYNPIAIAQYGLARFNQWCDTGDDADRQAWERVAHWLAARLRPNTAGVPVWFHDFDWPYRQVLRAPWYSGLAQGNGLSLLVRAAAATGHGALIGAAHGVFESFQRPVSAGGVVVTDAQGHLWIEEYLVDPPSHILNGFIWAAWGVYDYALWSRRSEALTLWERSVETMAARLHEFDTGWWSLYETPIDGRRMLASPYYHRLHITQLQVMHRLTGLDTFAAFSERFASYARNRAHRARAVAEKAWFKLRHY